MEHKSPQTSVCQKQLLIFISNMEHSQRFLETCKNSTKELANFSTKWILNMEHRSLKTSVFQNQLLIFVSNMEHSQHCVETCKNSTKELANFSTNNRTINNKLYSKNDLSGFYKIQTLKIYFSSNQTQKVIQSNSLRLRDEESTLHIKYNDPIDL